MAAERILIAEDEEHVARLLARTLELDGFVVEQTENGAAALDAFRRFQPHIVITDVNMPQMDGLQFIEHLRRESTVPVILLTGRSAEEDKVAGLSAGADDYVTKPFSPQELIARVRAILRRTGTELHTRVSFGEMDLDFAQQQVRVNGRIAKLSRLEFSILAHLVVSRGRIVYYDELLVGIWGAEYRGERHLLQVHIQRLRRKLAAAGVTREYISNRWGVGYVIDDGGPTTSAEPPPGSAAAS